ncbi:MAG TPA: phenylalanine--tRNA ligase subunit alpha [Armatimonadota bacterium]|nr:phenylalanine--tRNA ligase subunit alpha [Armatimonadota bacterium]HPO74634.1 phenylalanine--tRNA ligase subunit alpha [Armatimonadota bacterium]
MADSDAGRNALLESLHALEVRALQVLGSREQVDEEELAEAAGIQEAQARTALGWLLSKELVYVVSEETRREVRLTETGESYAERGTPEERIWRHLRSAGPTAMPALIAAAGIEKEEQSGAIGMLRATGAITIGPGGIVSAPDTAEPEVVARGRDLLRAVQERQPAPLESFTEEEQQRLQEMAGGKRKGKGLVSIDVRRHREYALTEEGKALVQLLAERGYREEVSQLTPAMLQDGSWRQVRFRPYYIGLNPPRALAGKFNSYGEFLQFVRSKLVAMGFTEVRGSLVENEFWDMDALYMPQFHPARNVHDVYFVKEPEYSEPVLEPFATRVAQAHENGGDTGSRGWEYRFDLQRSRRLILRSQGTALSARTLAAGACIPGKYFAVARCFRYDQVDATHASDFFQVEGIVVSESVNFRTLLGLLKLFAVEIARATEVVFAPAYFPFTEPSVEMHAKHPTLGWMELGGAGLFRPEVTRPLGVSEPVIAWGLGVDRMAMLALGLHDIRDLFSADLDLVRTRKFNP